MCVFLDVRLVNAIVESVRVFFSARSVGVFTPSLHVALAPTGWAGGDHSTRRTTKYLLETRFETVAF